jgi:hypothetical protein
LALDFHNIVEEAIRRHVGPWIHGTGFVEVAVNGVDVVSGSGSEVREVLSDAKGAGEGGFFAEVVAGDGLALAEFFVDIRRERGKTNLLGVAFHATVRGVDFLTGDGESGNGGRKDATGGLIGNGLKVAEIFERVIYESEPSGTED